MANTPDSLAQALAPLRTQIDRIDRSLLALLEQRAALAIQVGQCKQAHEQATGHMVPVLRPEREAQLIANLQAQATTLSPAAIDSIWTAIISHCRGLEQRLVVAFLGPEGSFSHEAVYQHYGSAIDPLPCDSLPEVFQAVETGRAQVGLVPIENSTEGTVTLTQDCLRHTSLRIHAETVLPVVHCLLHCHADAQGATRILAHPQALAQCQGQLRMHYPHCTLVPVASNAQAAQMAAQDASVMAIASHTAAQRYGLQIIRTPFQDEAHNKTRFLGIGHIDPAPSGCDRCSLVLAMPNRAGAIQAVLAPFSQHGVSLSRLESRPARTGEWEYYFYIDLLGHSQDAPVAAALAQLRATVPFVKMLGAYPQARSHACA